jgi:hypothetical protein
VRHCYICISGAPFFGAPLLSGALKLLCATNTILTARPFPSSGPFEGVKCLRPARFVLFRCVYNGGAQPVGVATRSRVYRRMEIELFLGFSPGVYMSTPGLGFTGDKIEHIYLLKGRKALTYTLGLQSFASVARALGHKSSGF